MTPEPGLTVRRAPDLIALVPYLLGFHPVDSLVAVALHGERLRCAARQDLPPPAAAQIVARELAALLAARGATSTILLAYGESGPTEPVAFASVEAFRALGVTVLDLL